MRVKLVGANPKARASALEELPGKSNYFVGNDPSQWRTGLPTYAKVRYENIYPGIDLVYYGNQRQLEYDLVVAPGADPSAIKLVFEGTRELQLGPDGHLTARVGGNELHLRKPLVYQEANGIRQEIAGRYVLEDANIASFELAPYDSTKPLTIDPVLVYSTYLGGSLNDNPNGIAVDSAGNVYVTGATWGSFPTTPGALQELFGGYRFPNFTDAFVLKLNPAGSELIYSTYLGGSDGDWAGRIAVDDVGNATIAGSTKSSNFPTTAGAFHAQFIGGTGCQTYDNPCWDGFVTKLDATGSALVYSTFIGGIYNDSLYGLALDSIGNPYVTGYTFSPDFPTTPGAFRTEFRGNPLARHPSGDCFLTKLDNGASGLVYSTYVDACRDVAVDNLGNAFVLGYSSVSKFNPQGSVLIWQASTPSGGLGIATDAFGDAFVTGLTDLGNRLGPTFVHKLDNAGTVVYDKRLGESSTTSIGVGIAADAFGSAYVTGYTYSPQFPTTAGAVQDCSFAGLFCCTNPSGSVSILYSDAFVTKLDPAGEISYSTCLGGTRNDAGAAIAVDALGNIVVAGSTSSTDFTVVHPLQAASGGGTDVFVAKIALDEFLQVAIDIKPGDATNTINLRSAGTVPVAILGSATFDPLAVDPATVTLAGAPVATRGRSQPMTAQGDFNHDGYLDLLLHFRTQDFKLTPTSTEAVLYGTTFSGQRIRGSDSVRIVRAQPRGTTTRVQGPGSRN